MKITKTELERLFAEAVSDEMKDFDEKTGGGVGTLVVGLMGASIIHNVLAKLFKDENENEIEIVKE